jgi:Cytochrome P450
MLPHSFVFGHLIHAAKIAMKYPPDTSKLTVPLLLVRENPELFKDGIMLFDTWPITKEPNLTVFHPDMMAQFTQETSLPKHYMMQAEFYPFSQLNDLVNQEGQVWKTWRSIFNPGFSSKNLLSLVPMMLEEILVFREWLKKVATTEEVIKLEDQARRVTIDVMGRAVL